MAIDVEIQDGRGHTVARYEGPQLGHQFTKLAPPDSACFRFIVPWGDATFNQETHDHGDADNNGGDDGFFKSFPAALLEIQLKAGRNLKRVLRIHTLVGRL